MKKQIDFAVGGQAVLEGVMMRSPNYVVIAVRKKNKEIKINKRKYQTLIQKKKYLNIPILRGMINLVEMMIVGTKAINYSANEMMDDLMTEDEKKKSNTKTAQILQAVMGIVSFVLAIFLALFLFKFLPLSIASWLETKFDLIKNNYMIFNLIDGGIKISIFLLYIVLLTISKNFRRLFEYHGAEHKSIFTYEKNLALIPDNAKKQIRFHPRCGTSFIIIVLLLSILVYTVVPRMPEFWQNLSLRVALLPLIAGISYECLKLSAKHTSNFLVKILITPGLWSQRLTTKEPDKSQLEVGLAALKEALELEERFTKAK
jgi:uncharacterized protein YqhQ